MGEWPLSGDGTLDDSNGEASEAAPTPFDGQPLDVDSNSTSQPDDAVTPSRRAAPQDAFADESDSAAAPTEPAPRRARRGFSADEAAADGAAFDDAAPTEPASDDAAPTEPASDDTAPAAASSEATPADATTPDEPLGPALNVASSDEQPDADVPPFAGLFTAEVPGAAGVSGGAKSKRPWGKHRTAKIVLIVLVCLALVAAGLVYIAYAKLNSRVDRADVNSLLGTSRPTVVASAVEQHSTGDPFAGQAQNILVIGSDSRAGDNAAVSNDTDDGQRSDTTFILHVSADRTRVQVVSIPRDTLITIPQCVYPDGSLIPQAGYTKQKFNSAFAYASSGSKGTLASGVACTIRAVEAMSNVHIDHYVVIDFAGFAQIVSAIGGVQLYLWCPVKSPDANNLSLPAGTVTLDGDEATNYARARKGQGLGDGSDLMRIQRQQALFDAVAKKVMGMNLLTNINTLYNFVGSVADAVTTDPEMGSIADMAGFAYSLRNFSTANLTFTTIPIRDAGDGANVVLVPSLDAPVWQALANDTPIPGTIPTATPNGATTSASGLSTPAATVATSSGPSGSGSSSASIPPGVVTAPLGQC